MPLPPARTNWMLLTSARSAQRLTREIGSGSAKMQMSTGRPFEPPFTESHNARE
ncbi:hypothetical protein CBOM_03584 [Ceraceosorus bombacis]|uniref:Uncharacterized protein n=1 Tax=Ceraceosorus bombacis TaxID=401625 RepID=A0A0N7LA07_9BASI|nr:hypothetical protein CBOM_03584 [Ceraceosorus bombacis]